MRSGAEQRAGRRPVLLNARGHGAMREKGGGVGSVPRGGKIGAEREGYAAVPRELAQHRRSGSRPLDSGGRHTSRRRGCDRGGDRRERREAQRLTVGHDDAGAWWAAARCGRVR
jgi:hypothetical protein